MFHQVNYYEDGMICVILSDKGIYKRKQLENSLVEQYVMFPQSRSLHIYGVCEQNYEQVHALVRAVKSLSEIDIFCYTSESSLCTKQLAPMCTKVIRGVF